MIAERRSMNSTRHRCVKLLTSLLATVFLTGNLVAQENSLRFQRPNRGGQATQATSDQKFRAPSQPAAAQPAKQASEEVEPAAVKKTTPKHVASKPQAKKTTAPVAQQAVPQSVKRDTRVRRAQSEAIQGEVIQGEPMQIHSDAQTWEEEPVYMDSMPMGQPMQRGMAHHGGMPMGHPHGDGCQCESCMCDPGCGMYDPGCGISDPGCGIADPSCGVAEPNCGSCVGVPGPDYWCFPVCFPRLKDLTLWGGVHGFRGPRDFNPGNRSDSNFGFQEGVNISGRAPLVGLLFPEMSYQLGYQAFQSRLYGTDTSSDDRGMQFVTAGVFRRTQAGLQFGAVFDSMSDDLDAQIDLNQVRYEISLKTPRGRELGFWGASSTNDAVALGVNYESVDQYCGFYRWNFKDGYQGRIWGGATGEGEGILGADFYAPLTDRWSIQTGFNFLLPNEDPGPAGVAQESWNLGINLVWHLGRTARKGCRSPFRPLFPVADNGWMFVDQVD
jgi:hypothetical protein